MISKIPLLAAKFSIAGKVAQAVRLKLKINSSKNQIVMDYYYYYYVPCIRGA